MVLSDAQSWLLALLGVGFSLSALISASSLDDRYLFYGDIGRAREEAFKHFNNEKTIALEGFMTRRDEAVEQMTQVIDALRRQEYDKRLAIDGRNRLHRDFCAYLDHLATAHQRLVTKYREANEEARGSANAPQVFSRSAEAPGVLGSAAARDGSGARRRRARSRGRAHAALHQGGQRRDDEVRRCVPIRTISRRAATE